MGTRAQLIEDPAKVCSYCEAWNQPQEPFQVYGNTWYVGTAGLAAILITTDEGLILIDGGLAQSASLVDQNIRSLGFDTRQVKYLLNSHAHYDHAGGLNALQKRSKARVLASADSIGVLETGELGSNDPQFGFGAEANRFPPVSEVSLVPDGGTVTLGAVSADDFQFSDTSRTPMAAGQITVSAQLIRDLDCDVLLSPHPFLFRMSEKLLAMATEPGTNLFVEEAACEAYADFFDDWLARRLAEEQSND